MRTHIAHIAMAIAMRGPGQASLTRAALARPPRMLLRGHPPATPPLPSLPSLPSLSVSCLISFFLLHGWLTPIGYGRCLPVPV